MRRYCRWSVAVLSPDSYGKDIPVMCGCVLEIGGSYATTALVDLAIGRVVQKTTRALDPRGTEPAISGRVSEPLAQVSLDSCPELTWGTTVWFHVRFFDEQACGLHFPRSPAGRFLCPRCQGSAAWPIAGRGDRARVGPRAVRYERLRRCRSRDGNDRSNGND